MNDYAVQVTLDVHSINTINHIAFIVKSQIDNGYLRELNEDKQTRNKEDDLK